MRLRTFPVQNVLRAGAVQPSGSENYGAVSVKSGAGGVVPPSRARSPMQASGAGTVNPGWGNRPLHGVSGSEALSTLNRVAPRLGGSGHLLA
jgi:hypothetical protein